MMEEGVPYTPPGHLAEEEPEPEQPQLPGHSMYPSWVLFGVWTFTIGLGTFVSQALFLSALPAGCAAFLAVVSVFLVVGLLMMTGGLLALCKRAMQPRSKAPTNCQVVGRIILFFFTFLLSGVCMVLMVVGGGVYTMKKNVPALELDHSGGAAAGNLSSPVTIVRDSNGIPHITAETMDDAFFGQGFVTAQDRLFQLDAFRLFALGRLAEVAGPSAVQTDKLSRSLGIRAKAEEVYPHLPAAAVVSLNSYVGGINLYLEEDGAMPPEFMFFGDLFFSYYHPEPFTELDVVAMMLFMQYLLSHNPGNEKMRWKLFNQAGMSYEDVEGLRYADFTNISSVLDAADWNLTETNASTRRAAVGATQAAESASYMTQMSRFRDTQPLGTTTASYRQFEEQADPAKDEEESPSIDEGGNMQSRMSWAEVLSNPKDYIVAGMVDGFHNSFFAVDSKGSNGWFTRHAATGIVTGGGDPHLAVSIPNTWYNIQLDVAGSVDDYFSGMSIPGVPGVLYGRNKNVMWSITISYGDLIDLYVMEPDQTNKNSRYMYHGQSLAYTTRTETIKVRGQEDDVTFVVQESVLGPLVGEAYELTTHHKIALNFTGCLGSVGVMRDNINSFTTLFRSSSVSELKSSLERLGAPGLSVTAGDVQGGLMFMANGHHPIRRPGHTGKWPVLGDGTYDYLGFVPRSELPFKLDLDTTKDGFVSSANQRVTPDGYPYSLAFDYVFPYRGDRIKYLLGNATPVEWTSVDFHKSLQTDIRSNRWLDYFKPKLQSHGTAWTSLLDVSGTALWATVLAWDGQASFGSSEAYHLDEWTVAVAKLPTAALETLGWDMLNPATATDRLLLYPTNATNSMCAQKSGNGATDCLPWLAAQWNQVATQAPKNYGVEYGALKLRHMIFSPFMGCLSDRVVFKQGDVSSININGLDYTQVDPENMYKTWAPNFRHLMSTNWTGGYYFTMVAGQSAHMFSPYYANQINDIGTDTYHFVELGGNPTDGQKRQVLSP